MKFEKWSISDSQKELKTICLINHHKTNLIFTANITGPFKITNTNTNSPLKYNLLSSSKRDLKAGPETSFNLA